ncbi:type 1 pili tip component [Inmirania thermothiophila]|nr:type 1 pili tip component [Inmirania thermothiophila]
MRVRDLIETWTQERPRRLAAKRYEVRLPLEDAARIEALAELYGREVEEVVTDLLSAALNEVEATMPYVPGTRVVAEDEQGDPIYEDVGPTPRFAELTRRYLRELEAGGDK